MTWLNKKILFTAIFPLLIGLFSPIVLADHQPETIDETSELYLDACDDDALHEHGYTNTSTPRSGYDSWAFVYDYRIYLHDDFVENIDLSQLACSSGSGTVDCDGGWSDADGGTRVMLYEGDGDSDALYPYYIQWTYGINDTSDVPALPGYNDYDGDGTIDTPNESQRTMSEEVYFVFNGEESEASATTTSAVYIKFYEYNQSRETWTAVEEGGHTDWHWNNDTDLLTTYYECNHSCSRLSVSPTSLGVDDVYSQTEFDVTGYYNNGTARDRSDDVDITSDLTFQYSANAYDGSDASGNFSYSRLGIFWTPVSDNPWETSRSSFRFGESQPGDSITIQAYMDGEEQTNCSAELEFPYCADLQFTDPATTITVAGIEIPWHSFTVNEDSYDDSLSIEATASNGENWPYDVTYESTDTTTPATFDGGDDPAGNPYTVEKDETSPEWTVDYYSEESATVYADAEDDVAGACSDYFTYTLVPPIVTETPYCEYATLTNPFTASFTEEELSSDQTINWMAFETDGSPETIGPWFLYTSDDSGSFTDSSGNALPAWAVGATDGYLVSGTQFVLLADTLTPGATIYIEHLLTDAADECDMTITTESEEIYCESLIISDPSSGVIPVDEIGNAYIAWTTTLSDGSSYLSDYGVQAYDSDGNALTTRGTFYDVGGGLVGIGGIPDTDGFAEHEMYYEGEPGDYIVIWTTDYPDEEDCIAMVTSEIEEEEYVCTDLALGTPYYEDDSTNPATQIEIGDLEEVYNQDEVCWPITVTLEDSSVSGSVYAAPRSSDDETVLSGEVTLTIDGEGSITSTSGNIAQVTVAGESEYTGTACWTGYSEGDTLDVYFVPDDAGVCEDTITLPTQGDDDDDDDDDDNGGGGGGGNSCDDLILSDEDPVVGEDFTTTVEVTSDVNNQDLIVEYSCEGKEITVEGTDQDGDDYSGSSDDGELEIQNFDRDAEFEVTFEDVCEDAHFDIYVQWENACDWEYDMEELVCEIQFEDDNPVYGEDFDTCLDIDYSEGAAEVNVEYSCPDGDNIIEYDGEEYDGELTVDDYEDSEICVTFQDFCQGGEIYADIDDDLFCSDELSSAEPGDFKQYIFTFNFAVEKNAYSDEGVFWSHDEDRAFYTSEYDPSGTEDSVAFYSDMWTASIPGSIASGDSGGSVTLADSYSDLTSGKLGEAYGYSTIEGFGFGDTHELYSNDLVDYAEEMMNNGYYFVPYIKFNGANPEESLPIYECEYAIDEDTGEEYLDSNDVCFNPNVTPESDGSVVIENAGLVEDEYGSSAVIRVRTVGIVNSQLDCSNTDECNTEQFISNAWVEVAGETLEDEARLVVLCPYLITRNAGDVYLEVELESGSNIACIFEDEDSTSYSGTYANTDSLVVLEVPDSTSTDDVTDTSSDTYIDEYFTSYEIDVDFCSSESDDSIVGNLSSYVCEIVTEVSDLWKSATVESTTEQHVSQSIRNAFTSQRSTSFTTFETLQSELTNQNNPESGILYYDGSSSGDITIGGPDFIVPDGAWTLIVANANLVIGGDIQYATSSNYSNLPSIAFIVTDGDIYIEKDASNLVGVYYTNGSIDGDERSPVDDPLEIDGSVYGNIQALLDAAQYVGSPNLDEGGVVIRYDSRILLNTPPGLSEYVDVNTQSALN